MFQRRSLKHGCFFGKISLKNDQKKIPIELPQKIFFLKTKIFARLNF